MYRTVKLAKHYGKGATENHLADILNQHAQGGWEYVGCIEITETEEPGCLGAFFGQKTTTSGYTILIFRSD